MSATRTPAINVAGGGRDNLPARSPAQVEDDKYLNDLAKAKNFKIQCGLPVWVPLKPVQHSTIAKRLNDLASKSIGDYRGGFTYLSLALCDELALVDRHLHAIGSLKRFKALRSNYTLAGEYDTIVSNAENQAQIVLQEIAGKCHKILQEIQNWDLPDSPLSPQGDQEIDTFAFSLHDPQLRANPFELPIDRANRRESVVDPDGPLGNPAQSLEQYGDNSTAANSVETLLSDAAGVSMDDMESPGERAREQSKGGSATYLPKKGRAMEDQMNGLTLATGKTSSY